MRRLSLGVKPAQIEDETQIMEETKLQCTPCTDAADNILLDDPAQQAPLPDCISIDQYVCSHRGRLTIGYGKTLSAQTYGGGTICVDHASGCIHVEHQISLSAADTIRSKRNFERI